MYNLPLMAFPSMLKFPGVLKQAQLCDVMPLMELCYHGDRRAPSQNSTEFWQLKKLQKFQLSHHLRTFQHLQMWKLPRSEALLVCLRSYGLWAMRQSSAYICVCVCVCVCVRHVLRHFSHVQLFVTLWTTIHQASLSRDSPGKNILK